MNVELAEEKAIGLIFDLSLKHETSGRRTIDVIKREFIEYIRGEFEDGSDAFYLYHPKLDEAVYSTGDAISAIGNYETDGWLFNLNYAFKQTMYVLEAQDPSYKKQVILVSDRHTDPKVLEKAFFINDKDMIDCKFFIILIGEHPNLKELIEIAEINHGELLYVNEAQGLAKNIKEIGVYAKD